MINDFGSQVQLRNLFNLANQIDFEPDIELEDFNEAVLLVKRICKDFGHHSSSQWKVLTESFFRQEKENGPFKIHFDPAIVSHFRRFFSVLGGNLKTNLIRIPDLNFWAFYDNLNCKTLLLRGMESSLLDRDTAIQMTKRGPKPKLVEFAGIGPGPYAGMTLADLGAEVIEINRSEFRAKVKGLNIIKKHVKTTKEKKGGIFEKENFINISNLAIVDNEKKIKEKTKK